MTSPEIRLGEAFASRDPAHIARWVAAQMAGAAAARAARRCEATAHATGARCRLQTMLGSRRCFIHCIGPERDALDARRLPRLAYLAGLGNGERSHQARAALARIERRRLQRAWLGDPTLPGATIALTPHDEDRVKLLLRRDFNVDVGTVQVWGRELTPRAYDRLLWAGGRFLRKISTREAAQRRVKAALCDDERFWKRIHASVAIPLEEP